MLTAFRNVAVVSAVFLFAIPPGEATAVSDACRHEDSFDECDGGGAEVCPGEECDSYVCDDITKGMGSICH